MTMVAETKPARASQREARRVAELLRVVAYELEQLEPDGSWREELKDTARGLEGYAKALREAARR